MHIYANGFFPTSPWSAPQVKPGFVTIKKARAPAYMTDVTDESPPFFLARNATAVLDCGTVTRHALRLPDPARALAAADEPRVHRHTALSRYVDSWRRGAAPGTDKRHYCWGPRCGRLGCSGDVYLAASCKRSPAPRNLDDALASQHFPTWLRWMWLDSLICSAWGAPFALSSRSTARRAERFASLWHMGTSTSWGRYAP